ncbi:MAG: L-threonylcarbamoyladenylate synthase [Deltaproteobacteria bacterium]|nr:L-threonylcarbamoyladenylate synthase [Deltaproteobacteria bacterium]
MRNIFRQTRGHLIRLEDDGTGLSETAGQVVDALNRGEVMAFPTDTVYGLGCRADLPQAVKKIYRLKGRNFSKPLILFIKDHKELTGIVRQVPEYAGKLIDSYWPGPLTMVFPASDRVKKWGLDKNGTIGIRLPKHKALQAILEQLNCPLATTSANVSGAAESCNAGQVMESFKDPVELILDGGELPRCRPSTVLDLSREHPVILRRGDIGRRELSDLLQLPVKQDKVEVLFICTGNTCRSPMAEGYLKHILPKQWKDRVTVRSCGTRALPGMPATDKGQETAKKCGFDLSGHHSRTLTDSLMKQSDIIIALEEGHRQDAGKLFPKAQVDLLSVDGVADPIGGTLDDYARTLELIKREMPDVLEKIKEILA